jgi:ABC-2 type transport system ATP-binding protein
MAVGNVVLNHPKLARLPVVDAAPSDAAVTLQSLRKVFPDGTVGLDGVSFSVPRGSIFGLLGPNGAGKSTLIRLICGLIRPTSGRVLINDIDPHIHPKKIKELLGGLLQEAPVEHNMRVGEVLTLFGSFYRNPLNPDRLLELVGLGDKRNSLYHTLSGGQKQRLAIARALIGNPAVLILDEPTTGLDVAIRHELIQLIRQLRREGRTVLISTHYIDEVEECCDRVAIVCHGKLFAVDTPEALVRDFGRGDSLEITLNRPLPRETLAGIGGVREISGGADGKTYVLTGQNAELMLQQLVIILLGAEIQLQTARVIRSRLEGAYLQLTGETIGL